MDDNESDPNAADPGRDPREVVAATTVQTSAYKVLGETDAVSGIGVLGRNTADSGTPVGVYGTVPNNPDGFGFATPDAARIEGDVETTDEHVFTVDGEPALRLGPTTSTPFGDAGGNVVGGWKGNDAGDAAGAVIAGGGDSNNGENQVTSGANYSVVGGGRNNVVLRGDGTISGGESNRVVDNWGTIGGGLQNTADLAATVGGGIGNDATATQATVAGGSSNDARTTAATVGGGTGNKAGVSGTTRGSFATVGGGETNEAFGDHSTIGGGQFNETGTVSEADGARNGKYATIPGGRSNVALGDYSFAGGRGAQSLAVGGFTWADSTDETITNAGSDNAVFQVANGFGINVPPRTPKSTLDVQGGNFDLTNSEGDVRVGNDDHRLKIGVATGGGGAGIVDVRAESTNVNKLNLGAGTSNVVSIETDSTNGVYPATDDAYSLGKSGNRWTAVWATTGSIQTSDARAKTGVTDLNDGLDRVSALRPVEYRWDGDGDPDAGAEDTDDGAAAPAPGDGDPDDDVGREGSDTRLGLIAQEVADAVPEAVVDPAGDGEDGDPLLGLRYDDLVPVLVDAVQQQQAAIEEREDRIDDLEARVAALEDGGRPDGAADAAGSGD